jgi:hypothetical protein
VLITVNLEVVTLQSDVDGPLVTRIRVVEEDRLAARDPPRFPQERAVDDRELQPLAAVDR